MERGPFLSDSGFFSFPTITEKSFPVLKSRERKTRFLQVLYQQRKVIPFFFDSGWSLRFHISFVQIPRQGQSGYDSINFSEYTGETRFYRLFLFYHSVPRLT